MLLLHALALVALVAAGALGWWQVGAWQEHRDDKADSLRNAAVVPLDEVLGPDDPFPGGDVGRPVEVTGEWMPGSTVYVDDWVVTPVLTASGSAVLVVRGSTPTETAPVPSGKVTLEGWLQPTGVVRVADILQTMDEDLYGGYVIARAPVEAGLSPVTPDQLPKPSAFTSLRNLLYGLEWWVFGAFAAFLWWRWCRDEIERVRSGTTTADGAQPAADPEIPSSA